ncbi:MAG TPA: hypothetical protein VL086_09725 [Candidatus Nitrosotalea sp.]|jgi:hypothetical protein|nr:hypothetical protein [Candidatus Nitrosotalea sp.]
MIERAWVGGVLAVIAGMVLPAAAGAGDTGQPPASAPMILNLMNRQVESRERAFTEDIKREALAPRPAGIDEWEPQPDGSMRNKKTGISITVRNPCPVGDIEHEFALAALNRSKSRR